MLIDDQLRGEWGAFWSVVNEGCYMFGGSIVSGIRSESRNSNVGGHPKSRHMLGFAADIAFTPGDDSEKRCSDCYKWFYEQGLHGYKRKSRTSIHIQDRSAKPPEGIAL
jgi:uncharacterized protein YcbK (DUF882 family)